ncbi:MAG: lamin tail domain-containing protein [Candidatus Buchananbacteria bacterium]|nr:lamin tail domain-containing protein [Candidatus Buchananbacteria bacterium]
MFVKKLCFIIPLLLAGFFLFLKTSSAFNNLEVVINEVAWMGTVESANSEWLELYNNSDLDIDLSGWTLNAQDGTPSISLSGTISAGGYFLLERTSDDSLPQITADQIYTGALGNSGEVLELKDADGNLIDLLDASAGWFSGDNDNKKTMERIDSSLPSQASNWSTSQLPNGTPQAQNSVLAAANVSPIAAAGDDQDILLGKEALFDGSGSSDSDGTISNYNWDFGDSVTASGVSALHAYNSVGLFTVVLIVTDNQGATSSDNLIVSVSETPTTTLNINSGDIVINEFVSDPADGQKEWIELYNNTTSTINLSGLLLKDGVGTISILSGDILPHDFKTFELSSSKLNNSGDKVVLNYQDAVIDQVTYGDYDDGNLADNAQAADNPDSLARKIDGQRSGLDKNDFAITTTPSKNMANVITAPLVKTTPSPPSSGGGVNQPVIISFNPSTVVINELVSDPADGEVEWIELYNNTTDSIELKGWFIIDGSGQETDLSGQISGHQFKIIASPKGNLNNSGDLVVLKDASKAVIDQVAYGNYDDSNVFDNAPKSDDPSSIARIIDGRDTNIDYNDFQITSSSTKGLPNIISSEENKEAVKPAEEIKTPTDYQKVIITEVLANPTGSDMENEFIEIYNPNDQAVDLSNWLLDDMEGGSRPYKIFGLVIEPHEYLSFFRKDTGLALNNTNDKARLINPLAEIVNEIGYETAKEGLSYALDANSKWQLTLEPTPGEENEIKTEPKENKTSVSPSKIVKITGTVLVEPGVLGAQIFYIASEDIQVYSYKKDFPKLEVGDRVEVTGEISETASEKRIKIKTQSDIKIISRQNEVQPASVLWSDIDDSYLGQLVKVAGEVIEVKGNYVFVDDGSEEIKVYLKQSAQIDKSVFKEGEKIEMVGLVVKSGAEYRLLPRYNTDILILGEVQGAQEEIAPSSAKNNQPYFIALVIFLGLIISWLSYKQFKLKSSVK